MYLELPKVEFSLKSFVGFYRLSIFAILICLNALLGSFIRILFLDRLNIVNRKVISPLTSRLALFFLGSTLIKPRKDEYPQRKVMYIFNHNSYLDIFSIPALNIPNSRYIISETTKNLYPLYLSNLSNDALFIPQRNDHEGRLQFFKNLTESLKNNDESIICSAEGTHTFKHYISKFNRGVFHSAMEANVDICLLFFEMKKEHNPFQSFDYERGPIKVSVLDIIETSTWTLDNLDSEIQNVRNKFVEKFNDVHNELIE